MSSKSSELTASDSAKFRHTPFYCEENVYMLCKSLCENGVADATGSDLFVVFISNDKKQVPLWHQKASGRADGIVLWDYHVICVQMQKGNQSQPLVWDLDSTLPFPSPLASYVAETIQPSFQLFSEYQRFFRVVHAPLFLKHFASDRRHMRDPEGNWIAQPPPHEPIVAEDGEPHNLNEYMAVSRADTPSSLDGDMVRASMVEKLGIVVSHSQLEELFNKLIP